MDCLSADHPAETVVFMASAQVGKTEVLLNWAGWVMDLRPAPMMLVLPTVGIAEDFSKQRVSGLIEATPSLAAKIGASRGRGASNTILNKEFPGGMLLMRGANSAAGLRSVPVQYLAMDEIDGYPRDVDGEGDPVKLAEARARTFARRKFFYCSTPTIKGESRIEEAYLETDQRKCFVPCPHCGVDQVLKFSQLRWPKGHPEKAAYLCEGCDDLIPETAKPWMLKNHRWVRTNPDAPPEKVGFHINALYSPLGWFSWAEIAAEFLDSHKSSFRLRTFVNTVLGETWESKGERPDWEKIYLRRGGYERGIVPEDGLVLTAGVDVQADRLECEVVAWGKGMKSWSVDYFVFPGDPARDETWDQLAELIDRQWPHASGGTLSLSRMCIDSGYATASVYKFCSRYLPTQVVAVKGRDNLVTPISAPRPVQTTAQGKHVRSGATLYHVGTDLLKDEIYGWLRQPLPEEGEETPDGWASFPDYPQDYFQQLVSEQLVSRVSRGRVTWVWEKVQERNEALDCRVYARAGSIIMGLDRWTDDRWDSIRDALSAPPVPAGARSSAHDGDRDYGGARRGKSGRRRSDWFD